MIGCGDIARKRIAPALRELLNTELVAVCRADSSRAEAFAHEFGEHPDITAERMRGARRAVAHLYGGG